MKAVHFGAGNIGRGFVGLLLHEGGYELVFSDVAASLVASINDVSEYTVHEVGEGGTDKVVTDFRAIDSSADAQAVIDEVATADVVTTAVGPTILRFVAPHIIAGLALRDPSAPPLQIMACENGINATDLLRDEMREQAGDGWDAVSARAVFANTAADRIVPAQPPGEGVDVTVEPFYEWAIGRHPFGDDPPHIPGALTEPAIAAKVSATLEETSALLEAVHGLDATELADYRATILRRFANPALPDTVERVGRQPLRKLSRNERFVSPASSAAERGLPTTALVAAMGAALEFDVPEDEQSVEMQRRLRDGEAAAFTASVTGLECGGHEEALAGTPDPALDSRHARCDHRRRRGRRRRLRPGRGHGGVARPARGGARRRPHRDRRRRRRNRARSRPG